MRLQFSAVTGLGH